MSHVFYPCVPQLGTSPLHLAAQHGHYSTADVLLRAGVSRDARTKVDRTPLHMAAAEGHTVIVELLVRVGPLVFTFLSIGLKYCFKSFLPKIHCNIKPHNELNDQLHKQGF